MGFNKKYYLNKLIMGLKKAVKSLMGIILIYAKRKKQRSEETSPFAIRYRAYRDFVNNLNRNCKEDDFFSIWCVDDDSIKICEDHLEINDICTLSFGLLNTLNKKLPALKVSIKLYSIGSMRITVNETDQLINMRRYKLSYDEVIKDNLLDTHYLIKKKNLLKILENDNNVISVNFEIKKTNFEYDEEIEYMNKTKLFNIKFCSENNQFTKKKIFTLRLTKYPFKLETFLNDEPIHTFNYNGHFNFERARPYVSKSQNSKKNDLMKMNNSSYSGKQHDLEDIYDLIERKDGVVNYLNEINSILKERKYHKKGWETFEGKVKNFKSNENFLDSKEMAVIDSYDIYNKNAWFDIYDRFPDYKIYGPTAVGTDIRIHNTSQIYGGAEHCTKTDLPEYDNSYRFYNLDVFTYEQNKPDALYGSIPLLVNVHSQDSKNMDESLNKYNKNISGILWLNPSDTFMDIQRKSGNKPNKQDIDIWWISETGIIDSILWVSDNFRDFYYKYHLMTGFAFLTPKFGLGKHQSRWNYFTSEEVLELSTKFEENDIPLDSIWLDIEHLNKRQCFTWNSEKFVNVPEMLGELDNKGRNLIVIADPHISIDENYHIYKRLQEEQDKFNQYTSNNPYIDIQTQCQKQDEGSVWMRVRNRNKWEDFIGICWPGKVKYPDFLNPKLRNIYSTFYTNKYYSIMNYSNIGFWIDMNEPSVFSSSELTLPKYSFHYDNIEHRQVHNLYSYYHLKSTFIGLLTSAAQRILLLNNISNTNEILSSSQSSHVANFKASKYENKKLNERMKHEKLILDSIIDGEKLVMEGDLITLSNILKNIQRPFILTRSFFVGSHCFGFTWTGDNRSDYDSFTSVIPMNLSNSICGFSYTGSDVAGFYGNPCKCLLINWHKLAIWTPFYRVHSHIDSKKREPWEFEHDILQIIRQQVSIRYELLPFWYTISFKYSFYGNPIMKPFNWLLVEFNNCNLKRPILDICENQCFLIGDIFLVYNTSQTNCLCKNKDDINFSTSINVLLPYNDYCKLTTWYEYNSFKCYILDGKKDFIFDYLLDNNSSFPCFVKESSIVPFQNGNVLSSNQQLQMPTKLKIYLRIDKNYMNCDDEKQNELLNEVLANGTLFLDDGISYNYLTGEYLYNEFYFIINNCNDQINFSRSQSQSQPRSQFFSESQSNVHSELTYNTDISSKVDLMIKSPMTPSSIFSSISSSSFYSTSSSSFSPSNSVDILSSTPSIISTSKIVYEIYSRHKKIKIYNSSENQFVYITSNIEMIRNKWIYRSDVLLENINIYGLIQRPQIIILYSSNNDRNKMKKLDFSVNPLLHNKGNEITIYNVDIHIKNAINLINDDWKISIYV